MNNKPKSSSSTTSSINSSKTTSSHQILKSNDKKQKTSERKMTTSFACKQVKDDTIPKDNQSILRKPSTTNISDQRQIGGPLIISHSSNQADIIPQSNLLNSNPPNYLNALQGVIQNVEYNGLTPTSQSVMNQQMEAALFSIESGLYGTWRSNRRDEKFGTVQDCSRIGPNSTCFCGHSLKEHFSKSQNNKVAHCLSCKDCKRFEFIPTTPEEIGEVWLVRRRNFYSQGAPCVFNTPLPVNPDYYWTSLASFRACLANIPADKDMMDNTLDIAVSTSNGYSYEYMVQNSTFSGSAYSLQVNLKNRIQQIRGKNYDYDYQFHKELMGLFFSLYDAHTIYMPPNPYKNSYLVFPFELTSSITNVGQVIGVKADNRLYNAITNSKGSGAAGKTIRTINGVKPKDFLDSIASTIFMSKEAASRFNEVFKMQEMSLGALIIPEFDSLNYVFSDGSSLNLPLVVLLSQQINGPRDFKSLMAAKPTNTRTEIRDKVQKRTPTMAVDPRMVVPELSIPKIVYKKSGFESKLRGMGGNLKLMYAASDKSIMYFYHTTRKISVFKIESFAPNYPYSQNPWDEFKSIVERGVAHAQSVGVKSLVIDLQGNGGGYVCLGASLNSYFVREYSDLSKLYQPYEFKKNPLVDSARPYFIQPGSMLNATTLKPFQNADFYERGATKNLGGVIASYSQQFYLDCVSEGNFFFKPATHFFNKMIILTDGLCGSTCSQFASKLIYNKKALAANVGGYDTTFETTAFNGGAVLHYDDLVKRGAPIPRLTKSNAVFTFNEFHMYLNAQQPIPREFQKLRGDIKINSWDYDDLEGLVDTVAPQFDKMTPLNQ